MITTENIDITATTEDEQITTDGVSNPNTTITDGGIPLQCGTLCFKGVDVFNFLLNEDNTYMLSGGELIDTENISLPIQNMKFGSE
jgi:hypothetical protein